MNNEPFTRRKAVALRYRPHEHVAPYVAAKGVGKVADEIIRIAEENDIPIQRDTSLVSILSQLELNEQIPEELYEVVAEILSFIYRLDQAGGSR